MKGKLKGKSLPHSITVIAFMVLIVLGLACASTPKDLDDLTTYTEVIELSGLSQEDVLIKIQDALTEFSNTNIEKYDQDSGIINGKLVVDGIIYGDQVQRYNSTFTVEVKDEKYQITFINPTIQDIGFVSEQAKERAFQSYLIGYNVTSSALSSLTKNVIMPSNSNINKTEAEIRAEWEKGKVFSSTNPSSERTVRYDYQVENVRKQWLDLTNKLRNTIN